MNIRPRRRTTGPGRVQWLHHYPARLLSVLWCLQIKSSPAIIYLNTRARLFTGRARSQTIVHMNNNSLSARRLAYLRRFSYNDRWRRPLRQGQQQYFPRPSAFSPQSNEETPLGQRTTADTTHHRSLAHRPPTHMSLPPLPFGACHQDAGAFIGNNHTKETVRQSGSLNMPVFRIH